MLGAGAGAVFSYFLLHFWSPEQGWSQGRCWEMCVEQIAESINQTQDFLTIIRLREVLTPSAQTGKKNKSHRTWDSRFFGGKFSLPSPWGILCQQQPPWA